MKLWYIDGSPYARIIRATLIEFGLAHEAIELEGFPPMGIAELSPALQVPVLETGGRRMFGSALIREYLHARQDGSHTDYPASLARPGSHWDDLQVLTAIQTLTDALVAHFHIRWAGFGSVARNRLGVDPVSREMVRALSLLDWLEELATDDGFWPGVFSPADMALAAALLWTEAREEIGWRGRPRLERIVARADVRASFLHTAPRPWRGSPKDTRARRE